MWRKPKRIFVNSMSDLFQDAMQDSLVLRIWRIMEAAHWHTFQVLTKRPENMLRLLSQSAFSRLPNVWLGVSVENDEYLERLDLLRRVPANIRFISFEPLLGPIIAPNLDGMHWAIVGGESGPRARPMERWWVEELRDSCKQQGVAFFFKQWGGTRKKTAGRLLEGRLWDEYPSVVVPG
jgi:protein gp37